jgi:hypothetical protein
MTTLTTNVYHVTIQYRTAGADLVESGRINAWAFTRADAIALVRDRLEADQVPFYDFTGAQLISKDHAEMVGTVLWMA